MTLLNIINFPDLSDERGGLVAIETGKDIPFKVERVYFIHSTQTGVSRGFHAHKKLKQIAFCVKGSCEFILDDGKKRETLALDNPCKGLLIESMIWREMRNFTDDCVLMVIASEHFSESDYIRDYDQFVSLAT